MRKKLFSPFILLAVIFFMMTAIAIHETRSQPTIAFATEARHIYLTFDDGPSTIVTNRILNTLRDKGVKATFFIVSDRAQSRKETLMRIVKEGHTVGVHSASHDYAKIYSSDEAFFNDVDECAKTIRSITNVNPSVYRFPGGGLSCSDIERRTAVLEQKGYFVVGWNAVCGDEEIPYADTATLVKQSIQTSKGLDPVILLLHDSAHHKETANALPAIIDYFRAQGYVFCTF